MATLGISDGSGSGIGEQLALRYETVPLDEADLELVVLPFGPATPSTEAALVRLDGPDPNPRLVGCLWTVPLARRWDAAFSVDVATRTVENHTRFLTATGWADCLLKAGGDRELASWHFSERSRSLLARSSNEYLAGTNSMRILDRLLECPHARAFVVAEAVDESGEWNGLAAVEEHLDRHGATRVPAAPIDPSPGRRSPAPRGDSRAGHTSRQWLAAAIIIAILALVAASILILTG